MKDGVDYLGSTPSLTINSTLDSPWCRRSDDGKSLEGVVAILLANIC